MDITKRKQNGRITILGQREAHKKGEQAHEFD
jgi:hypothetical protein